MSENGDILRKYRAVLSNKEHWENEFDKADDVLCKALERHIKLMRYEFFYEVKLENDHIYCHMAMKNGWHEIDTTRRVIVPISEFLLSDEDFKALEAKRAAEEEAIEKQKKQIRAAEIERREWLEYNRLYEKFGEK
jgi:hypothetical protein